MTKLGKKLFVAVVVLAGGLAALAWVLWWPSGNAPAFRFLGDRRPVYHAEYRDGSIDIYSWPAEFESVAAQAGKELLWAGFVDASGPGPDPFLRVYSRPGSRQIVVLVHRGSFEKETAHGPKLGNAPGWVAVEVRQGRFAPLQYLGWLWDRAMAPPPSLPPPQGAPAK